MYIFCSNTNISFIQSVHDSIVTPRCKDGCKRWFFCSSRSRDICVNGIHRHMKVVEYSSGGIISKIKESDLGDVP